MSQTNVLGSSLIGTPGANLPNSPGTFDPPDSDYDESDYESGYEIFQRVAETRDEVQPVNGYTNVQATKAIKVVGLEYHMPIQSFYVGSKYLYITQTKNKKKVYLTRCTLSDDTVVPTATYKDQMVLENIGKNQILEAYTYNDKMYFWIGCKPNSDSYDGESACNLTLQLGRIQYSAGTTISDFTDIVRFGSLHYANTSGTSFDTHVDGNKNVVKRIDAGLSSDKTKLIIATRSGNEKIQYSQYSNTLLNQALDAAENTTSKYVSFYQNDTLKAGCEFSCVQNNGERILPNGGFQGMDVTSGYYSNYVSGGTGVLFDKGDNVNYAQTPIIAKMVRNSLGGYTYSKAVKITNNLSDYTNDSTYLNATKFPPEIEGVKIVGDYLYFVLYPTVNDIRGSFQYIYKIDKTSL